MDFLKKLFLGIVLIIFSFVFFPSALFAAADLDPCPFYVFTPIHWADGKTNIFHINTVSFPEGEEQANDITQSMTEWGRVLGSDFDMYHDFEHLESIVVGDTISDVAKISEEDMTTLTGVPASGYSPSWYFFSPLTLECIIFSGDVLFTVDPGQALSMHELGHAVGFLHNQTTIGHINYGYGFPYPGSRSYPAVGKDRTNIRTLYGDPSEEEWDISSTKNCVSPAESSGGVNVYPCVYDQLGWLNFYDTGPTNEEWDDFIAEAEDVAYNRAPLYENLCPGDTIEIKKSVMNNGTQDVSLNLKYYFSTNENITTSDILAKSTSGELEAEEYLTNTISITVPSAVNYSQTYYVGVILDPEDMIEENLESNNSEALIQVTTGGWFNCGGNMVSHPLKEIPIQSNSIAVNNHVPSRYMNFIEATQESTGVYMGSVKSVLVKPGTDGLTPYTYIDFQVDQTLKGTSPSQNRVEIRMLGGAIPYGTDGTMRGLIMPDAPEFKEGDNLIIFLGKNKKVGIPFVSGQDGILKIQKNPKYGDIVTTYSGKAFVEASGDKFYYSIKELDNLFHEYDENQQNISLISKKTVSTAVPMTKANFIRSLKTSIQKNAPYPEIIYTESEAGPIKFKAVPSGTGDGENKNNPRKMKLPTSMEGYPLQGIKEMD